MRKPPSGKGKGKSPNRTRTAPGTMKHHQGHTSRSPRARISDKRWENERAKLVAEAPEGLNSAELNKWLDAEMLRRFRPQGRRKT